MKYPNVPDFAYNVHEMVGRVRAYAAYDQFINDNPTEEKVATFFKQLSREHLDWIPYLRALIERERPEFKLAIRKLAIII